MANYSSSIVKIANRALYKAYAWMFFGLTLTGIISYFVSNSYYMQKAIFSSGIAPIFIFILQMGIIFSMGSMINKMSYFAMSACFTAYSILNGLTLSVIFLVFDIQSIVGVFFLTAGIFGMMAVYGLFTKHNLNSFGVFGMASLFGVIILSFLNFFIRSAKFDFLLSFIAVLGISALIAYDMQKTKRLLMEVAYDETLSSKLSVYAALTMYINFISLFIHLINMLGKKRD